MAVSKMQQMVLLMAKSQQETVLKSLQEFQAFEPIPLEQTPVDESMVQELQANIQQLDQEIGRIRQAQTYLKPFTPKKIWGDRFLMTAEAFEQSMEQVRARDILSKVLTIQSDQQAIEKHLKDLSDHIDEAIKWQRLPFLKKDRRQLQAIYAIAGTISLDQAEAFWHQLTQEKAYFAEKLFQNDFELGLVVYASRLDKHALREWLETYHFDQYDFPYAKLPAEQFEDFKDDRQKTLDQQKANVASLKDLSQYYADLMLLEEDLYNQMERQKAELLMATGKDVTGLSGWVAVDDVPELKALLAETLPKGSYAILVDGAEVDEKAIPIRLKNHPLVQPFEQLTEMYSLPKYSEIDPTPYMAPFYAVFFGMMVADIGYGLLMWLGTGYALTRMKQSKGMRQNMKLFHILSYPTILWGIFFGSFFGVELPFHLLSTSTDVISILILSVVFGFIQLMVGLAINTGLQIKARDYPSAVSDGLGWIGLLVGVILLVVPSVTGQVIFGEIGKWVLIVNAVLIILGTAAGSKNKFLGLGSGLYKLYGATSYIGDIASYTRLMALCVSGASIAASFNMVVGLLPPLARFSIGIPLLVALQGLNFGMSLLSAYVHAIRLQFVEFFGKFYEGGGRAFKPLKTYEKYTDLETRKLEK